MLVTGQRGIGVGLEVTMTIGIASTAWLGVLRKGTTMRVSIN
jgi:hypothetical protein